MDRAGKMPRPTKAKGEILRGTKVDLSFLEVDLQDGDTQAGAGLVDFSGAATAKGALRGVEGEEVVLN
jgi:hypothetical protein